MHEQSAQLSSSSEGADIWNRARLTATLRVMPQDIHDETLGPGVRFVLFPEYHLTLDLYPLAGALRLQSPNTNLLLRRLGPPLIASDQVVFEQEQPPGQLRHISFTHRGEVSLLMVPVWEPSTAHRPSIGSIASEDDADYATMLA